MTDLAPEGHWTQTKNVEQLRTSELQITKSTLNMIMEIKIKEFNRSNNSTMPLILSKLLSKIPEIAET